MLCSHSSSLQLPSVPVQVIIVPMLAPRSYTREDVIEIQCHGGQVPVRRVLDTCLEAGARSAKPGERSALQEVLF